MKQITIEEINNVVKGTIVGCTTTKITAPEQLEAANETEISFIGNKKYEKLWSTSKACAAIVNEDISIEPGENKAFIKVKNADLAMSQVLALFAPTPPVFKTNIHPTASIDETAKLGNNIKIGANCYVGPNVTIGENTILYPNVTVLDECTIGKNTTLWPGAVIRERCHIGNDCIIHPNATIGADGFGFAPNGDKGWQKISQIGGVVIGNDVEIGASTTVDRGAINDTQIGNNVILDNHVQIAHNAMIGDNCAMAAYAGVAGSTVLGKNCILAAGAHVVGHASLCDNVQLMAHTLIFKDIKQPGSYSSAAMPPMATADWLKNSVRMGQLNDIALRLKKLEKNK